VLKHYAVAGLLVHGVYLGGVFLGISLGVEAGVSFVELYLADWDTHTKAASDAALGLMTQVDDGLSALVSAYCWMCVHDKGCNSPAPHE